MVILDDKGRLFGKLNIIDLIVIVVILLGLWWGVDKIITRYFTPQELDFYTIILRAEAVPPEIIDSIKLGDKLIERSGNVVGTVVEPKPILKPSEVYVQTREGLIVESFQPKLKDMDITVEVATIKGGRVRYNTNNVLVGSRWEYDFAGKGMIGIHVKALCVKITKK